MSRGNDSNDASDLSAVEPLSEIKNFKKLLTVNKNYDIIIISNKERGVVYGKDYTERLF
jgi:hypothetical protein